MSKATCGLCGGPMPAGEEAFMYHGFSGPCPVTQEPHDNNTDVSVQANLASRLRQDAIGHAPRRAERLLQAAAEIEHLRARVAELERLRVERRDVLRDAVIAAYQQGAMDVHQNYQPDRSPDFTEAAHDYADAALAQQEGEG